MADIDILVPYATTNYIKNPSVENNTTGWTAVGASISAVLTRARFGRKSLQVVTNGAALNEGTYYRVSDTSLKGPVFASVYVRGAGKIRLKVKDGLTGTQAVTPSVDLHDLYWQRLSVQGIADASDDLRLYIETTETAQSVTVYLDGAQIEAGANLSTYCDGDQDGCRWSGVHHASISTRPANTPEGGRWVSVKEDDCDPNTYITTFSGLGLPPITINRQRMALSPGAFFDSTRIEERVIQFTVNVKDPGAQRRPGNEKRNLYTARQHLIDLIKPDRDPNSEPMWMRYRDGDRSLMLRVLYESGLEFEGDFRNKWINAIPLRFLALDPYWYEDNQEVAVLDTETELDDAATVSLIARINGEWQTMTKGIGNLYAKKMIVDDNDTIYLGGSFTTDSDGNNLRYLAKYNDDYTAISEMATGVNSAVNDMAAHPNGKIYVVGQFTGDNDGNTYNRIVEYDPDTNSFAALGTGLDNIGRGVAVSPDGDVYAVGNFANAGGVAAPAVAKWDGGTWERVGDIVNDFGWVATVITFANIVIVSEDEIYAYGSVSDGASNEVTVAKFDGTSWSDVGSSVDTIGSPGAFSRLALDVNNSLVISPYPAGDDQLYRWNGSSYETIGSAFTFGGGVSSIVTDIAIDSSGQIYVVGSFKENGGVTLAKGIAKWNGSVWTQMDFNSNWIPYAILVTEQDDIFICLASNADPVDASSSGITSVSNRSTADCFPIVSFEGSQRAIWLENQTTGQIVYVDYLLQSQEILELDFRIGRKRSSSNYRGTVTDAILPNSSDFFLSPSDIEGDKTNKVHTFVINEVAPNVQLRYQPTHWSVDAISDL